MNALIVVFACLIGLLVGGILGGFSVAVFQQIRSGKIKIPQIISLGPLKLDMSGLSQQNSVATSDTDYSGIRPLLIGGGSATGGCLSLISALMILVGFILPWFTCTIPLVIQGNMSGLGALLQVLTSGLVSLLGSVGIGTQNGGGGLAALGLLVTLLLIITAIFLVLTPLAGIRIGRTGLQLIQSLKMTDEKRRQAGKALTIAAVVGLIPILCYTSSAMTNINILGFQASNVGVGLWVSLAGFVIAFVAGIVMSTAISLAEQLPKPVIIRENN